MTSGGPEDPLQELAKVLKRRRPHRKLPPEVLLTVLERDAYECSICHAAVVGGDDVTVPASEDDWGTFLPERLRVVCRRCQLDPEDFDVVVGVDAWKKGWIYVRLIRGHFNACSVASTIAEICELEKEAHVIACDIPIGLPDAGPRLADQEARLFIGPRASSVFSTLPESVLRSPNYQQASAEAMRLTGKSLSKQSFALAAKILEVASCKDPRLYEVHPEVTFKEMNGESVLFPKKSWTGAALRTRLLYQHGITLPEDLGAAGVVPIDDVLDAAAAAWSARRIKRAEARSLPDPPQKNSHGHTMAIWY